MENFEQGLELAANLAELIAGLVIIFSVIKVWPLFTNLATARPVKNDFTAEFAGLQEDLSKVVKGVQISSMDDLAHQILRACVYSALSDLQIDLYPQESEIRGRIRLRREGVLSVISHYDEALHKPLISTFKALAGMDDLIPGAAGGRMQKTFSSRSHAIDFRLGFAPANLGECLTIRVLDPRSARMGFDLLGYSDLDQSRLQQALAEKRGLLIFSGPIGSGKTVSLYTSLNSLDATANQIVTVEDPMEIELPNINQLPVSDVPGFRFSDLYAAAMRAGPDILMVGEIRNEETARACINAHIAQTLVLTSMSGHTAVDVLERLYRLNQDVDFYNLMVMNQRLVSRLCTECSEPRDLSADEETRLRQVCKFNHEDFDNLPSKFLRAVGCEKCESGYRGRVGGYETMKVTAEHIQALRDNQPSAVLWQLAIEGGARTIQYDLIVKAANGLTTVEEVERVVEPSYYGLS